MKGKGELRTPAGLAGDADSPRTRVERVPGGHHRIWAGVLAALACALAACAVLVVWPSKTEPMPHAGASVPSARGDARASGTPSLGAEAGPSPDSLSCDPGVLASLDVPAVCSEAGMLVETAHRPGWVRATWAFGRTLPEVIEPVLEGFRDEGLSLQYGGYLDLFQRVWGGVVGSELGWVELVIGQEPGEGGTPDDAGETCELSVVRLEGEAVEGLSLDTGSPA